MQTYIIRLSDFPNSVRWAKNAYDSALLHKWNVEYFEGVDGRYSTLEQYNLNVNPKHRKSRKAFNRVGTVGCLLSHYLLWQKCIDLNEAICILEHDVTIHGPFPEIEFKDVIKLASGPKSKKIYIGDWWSGTMGYCISPAGAIKLVNFSQKEGVMPSDTMLCDGIIDLEFYNPINTLVTYITDNFSFSRNL